MEDLTRLFEIYTLGCRVNQYESEAIASALRKSGFADCTERMNENVCAEKSKKVIIVNSCTVTGEADRKSRQLVRRLIRENPDAAVIVTGCAVEADPDAFSKIEGLYAAIGNRAKLGCVSAASDYVLGKDNDSREAFNDGCCGMNDVEFEPMNISAFKRTRAYLKIEDGCESKCSYCIIPHVRGRIRSKTPESVVGEAKLLVEGGCPEIVLTGVETSAYQYDLSALIEKLDRINGLERIRLGSLDPSFMKPDFVSRYAAREHTMPHFHLSMQSGCDRTLFAMRRRYNIETVKKYIDNIKTVIPGVCLSGDVICGFPGETEADFEETMEFFLKTQFLHLHIFPFSRRPGTEAADMPNQVSRDVIKRRVARLSEQQKRVKKDILSNIVRSCDENGFQHILVETVSDDGVLTGHNECFAEFSVDLNEKILSGCSLNTLKKLRGTIVNVRALYSDENTVFAVLAEN